jgi:hypothetical protein
MARRRGFFSTLVKISKDIERENNRAANARAKAARNAARDIERAARARLNELKQQKRMESVRLKELKAAEKIRERADQKASQKAAKDQRRHLKAITEVLSVDTEVSYGLGRFSPREKSKVTNFSVHQEFLALKASREGDDEFVSNYGAVRFEDFVLNGALNSVLGVDGLVSFRKDLDALDLSYDDKNTKNEMNAHQDYLFCSLFRNGVYKIDFIKGRSPDLAWLTAFRYLTKNELIEELPADSPASQLEKLIRDFKVAEVDSDLFSEADLGLLANKINRCAAELALDIWQFITDRNRKRLAG